MLDILLDSPGNPRPDRATAGYFAARDGKKMRYALFGATGRPLKGTVILVTGRNEFIEKYFETIRDLAARGFGVAIADLRGQGLSHRAVRHRGHIGSFRQYVDDLEQFFETIVLPDCRAPFYILAHSAGALIALLAAPNLVHRVRRLVLSAPLLEFHDMPVSPTTLRRATAVLRWLGLGRMYAAMGPRRGATPFPLNQLTTDMRRYARNTGLIDAHPELALGGPTVAWMHAALAAAAAVQDPAFTARLQLPVLFVTAGADTVVSTPATERYARRLRAGSLLTIDGARHELLQEADVFREQFLAAFDAFVPGTDAGI